MPSVEALPTVAKVRILELPMAADRVYDYKIPEEFIGEVGIGSMVDVPLGAVKHRTAVVVEVAEKSEYSRLREIEAVAEGKLKEWQVGLCRFLSERTFCSMGEAVQTVIPSGIFAAWRERKRESVEWYYRLNEGTECDGERKTRLSPQAERAIAILTDGEKSRTELKKAGVTDTVLQTLQKKNLIVGSSKRRYRNPYAGRGRIEDGNILSEEQQSAVDTLTALSDKAPCAALLWGVTGSGKTRVMEKVIDHVTANGKSVILLVPEISLTGQTVDFFCGYYKERVAVIHSGLSEGEKADAYRRISEGEVDIVIGTRSAVFAPFENLGMIVIDEEQEHTYKSDMTPKYHTLDVARYRCAKTGAFMLLSSATPSFEAFYRAKEGVYTLVKLTERYGKAVLPEVMIADLREDMMKGRLSPIGGRLSEEIEKNIAKNEQTILYVGRRGYYHFVSCKKCGEAVMCPNCSVSLTYHREQDRGREVDRLKCHYCGYTEAVPERCPKCGSVHIGHSGFGTQWVAEELAAKYPTVRVLRMDADVTGTKLAHDEILAKFRSHEADILIGTQMVTKGHNFPDVTLVGVINADASLYLDDFRATEHTFALLTQVIGRSGRFQKAGQAVLQTYSPENDVIRLAAKQDYETYYEGAIGLREQLKFPPFCDIMLFVIAGEEEEAVKEVSERLSKQLRVHINPFGKPMPMFHDDDTELPYIKGTVFGAFEAPVYKVNNIYRMRMIIKCTQSKEMRQLVRRILERYATEKASVSVDINPTAL